MGLSSNIVWHQTSVDSAKEILSNKKFLCSYSMETIHWRRSKLEIAFPMVSFCDLPLSDMTEYLKDNISGELTGKYGPCTIGISYEWATRKGLSHVWYHNAGSRYLSDTLPCKSKLLKSLKSRRYMNRWAVLSRIKPFMGKLESHGFSDYRFYDEKEIRYVPSREDVRRFKISPVLEPSEYEKYRESSRRFSRDTEKGNAFIQELSLSFNSEDVLYILIANDSDKEAIMECIKDDVNHIVFLTYKKVVEEIIGTQHYAKV